jgi:hypothetical protein
MSVKQKRIVEKVTEIIQDEDRCDIRNNMYSPDLETSMKVSWLLELAKKEKKILIIEGCGQIYYGTKDSFSRERWEEFTSRVVVDLGLSKATQDLSDDMLSQLEDKYGPVQYELRQYFIEGISLIEVTDDSIVIELSVGT